MIGPWCEAPQARYAKRPTRANPERPFETWLLGLCAVAVISDPRGSQLALTPLIARLGSMAAFRDTIGGRRVNRGRRLAETLGLRWHTACAHLGDARGWFLPLDFRCKKIWTSRGRFIPG